MIEISQSRGPTVFTKTILDSVCPFWYVRVATLPFTRYKCCFDSFLLSSDRKALHPAAECWQTALRTCHCKFQVNVIHVIDCKKLKDIITPVYIVHELCFAVNFANIAVLLLLLFSISVTVPDCIKRGWSSLGYIYLLHDVHVYHFSKWGNFNIVKHGMLHSVDLAVLWLLFSCNSKRMSRIR